MKVKFYFSLSFPLQVTFFQVLVDRWICSITCIFRSSFWVIFVLQIPLWLLNACWSWYILLLYHYLVPCHFVTEICVLFQLVSNTPFFNFGFGLVIVISIWPNSFTLCIYLNRFWIPTGALLRIRRGRLSLVVYNRLKNGSMKMEMMSLNRFMRRS